MLPSLADLTLTRLRKFSIAYGALIICGLLGLYLVVTNLFGARGGLFFVGLQTAGFLLVFELYMRGKTSRRVADIAIRQAGDLASELNTMQRHCRLRSRMIEVIGESFLATMRSIDVGAEFLFSTDVAETPVGKTGSVEHNMLKHARKGVALSQDIVEYSQLRGGRVRLVEQEIDPVELMSFCMATVRKNCEAGCLVEIVSTPHERLVLNGDLGRLKQLLIKLLGFFCKASNRSFRSAKVRISLESDGDLIFGMTSANFILAEQVFRQMCDPLEDASGGKNADPMVVADFSLAIASQIACLHGGEISIAKGVGLTTELQFRLPKARVAAVKQTMCDDVQRKPDGQSDKVIFQIE